MSDADYAEMEKLVMDAQAQGDLDLLVGKELHNQDNIRMVPDILQNGDDFFFPVFTTEEEMGEYIIYYRGKIVGGVYDDRFLVKPMKAAKDMMPEAELELPYEGAKEMLLVDNIENKEFLRELLEGMYGELPAPKKKK